MNLLWCLEREEYCFQDTLQGQTVPCFGEKLSYRPVLLVTCSTAYRTTVRKGQFVISLKFLRR